MSIQHLLEITHLKKTFVVNRGMFSPKIFVKAVDDVSFNVIKSESFGIVGESGCGKTTIGRLLVRLTQPTNGTVHFENEELFSMSRKQFRKKQCELQMIFQDPFASLNPRIPVGRIIGEPLAVHGIGNASERRKAVEELLEIVGLKRSFYKRYPHEFSGGQRQRICIARALVLKPKVIVADEPVSALDVSIQSQILNLMRNLQKELGLTYIFISHDLSVVKHFCNRIAVMYLGKFVETASKVDLYRSPLHPYTQSLLSAIPVPDPAANRNRIVLTGDVPSPANPPSGCSFHTRCPKAMDICSKKLPVLRNMAETHQVACHLY
ncbi:dipeptide ABC transporter ATP-binding protein [bacterium]|nr:dipeptide ABC transporter ATP-binding protein [bacterium]